MTKKKVTATRKKAAKKSVEKKSAKASASDNINKKTTKKKVAEKKINGKKAAPKKLVQNKKALTSSGKKVSKNKGLTLGQKMPALDFLSTNGTFNISKYKGKNVILYFYPKDHTSGCTIEGHDFTSALDEILKLKAMVFGISRDSLISHQKFIEKQNYKHALISDEDEKLCKIFGVIKEKNMYGRKYLGIDRSTFIFNADSVLVAEFRGVKVKGHVDQVLDKLKGL